MRRVILAAGGTGGHLFPAQRLASDLIDLGIDVLFLAAGLGSNRFFCRERFPHRTIDSASPKNLRSLISLARGTYQSLGILSAYKPDLIVGFGSFHSFPVLAAAFLKGLPYMLFESNAMPGKVNRLFAPKALLSAVQFQDAAEHLKGRTLAVDMPLWKKDAALSQQEARRYFGLDPSLETVLIFGGSQGAASINDMIRSAFATLPHPFQVIHLAGLPDRVGPLQKSYEELQIRSIVKPFEENMASAWRAADLCICRAGAATLSEAIFYEVPTLLIPYPHATDDHQRKNAEFMERQVGGGLLLAKNEDFVDCFKRLRENREAMKEALSSFKKNQNRQTLASIVMELCKKNS